MASLQKRIITGIQSKEQKRMNKTLVTVAHGDGIGPEIMDATLHILHEAGARLDIETIDIGEKVYLAGNTAGSQRTHQYLRQILF